MTPIRALHLARAHDHPSADRGHVARRRAVVVRKIRARRAGENEGAHTRCWTSPWCGGIPTGRLPVRPSRRSRARRVDADQGTRELVGGLAREQPTIGIGK